MVIEALGNLSGRDENLDPSLRKHWVDRDRILALPVDFRATTPIIKV
jgi:hypothetical protein